MTASSAALATANQLPQRSSRVLASTTVRHARARSFVHDASDQRVFRPTTLNTGWRGAIRRSSDSGVLCCYAVEELPGFHFPASQVLTQDWRFRVVRKLLDPNRLPLTTEAQLGLASNAKVSHSAFWYRVLPPQAQGPLPSCSITWSARCRSDGGIVRPRALAVLRLMTSSNLVGCSIGRSEGFAPLRILSTYSAAYRNSSEKFDPYDIRPLAATYSRSMNIVGSRCLAAKSIIWRRARGVIV